MTVVFLRPASILSPRSPRVATDNRRPVTDRDHLLERGTAAPVAGHWLAAHELSDHAGG